MMTTRVEKVVSTVLDGRFDIENVYGMSWHSFVGVYGASHVACRIVSHPTVGEVGYPTEVDQVNVPRTIQL